MLHVTRPRNLLLALVALGLPLAACGSDDSSDAAPPTTAASATAATGTSSGGAIPGSSLPLSTTSVAAPATTAGGPTTTAAKRADCLAVADLYNRILLGAGLGGGAVSADKLAKLKTTVTEVTAAAPADLKAQFAVVGEAYIASGTNGDTSKLTSAAYATANNQLAAIVTTC